MARQPLEHNRTPPAAYMPSVTAAADEKTVARWVKRLRSVVAGSDVSPAYRLARLGVPGSLAAQVLAAYEAAE